MNAAVADVLMDVRAVEAVVRVMNVAMEWDPKGHTAGRGRSAVMMAMGSVAGRSRGTSVSPLPMNHHPCGVAAVGVGLVAREARHREGAVAVSPLPADLVLHHPDVKTRMPVGQRPMSRTPTSSVRISMRTSRRSEKCVAGETNPLPEMSKASRIGNSPRRTKATVEYVHGSWNN